MGHYDLLGMKGHVPVEKNRSLIRLRRFRRLGFRILRNGLNQIPAGADAFSRVHVVTRFALHIRHMKGVFSAVRHFRLRGRVTLAGESGCRRCRH